MPSVARGGRTGGGAKDKIKSRVRTLLEMGGSRRNGGTSKGAPRSERAKQRGHARNADREHQVQDTAAAVISVSGPDGTTGEEEASRRVWPSRVLPRPAGGMLRTGSGGESGSGGAVSPVRPHARIGVLAAAAAAAAAAAEQRPSDLTAAPRVVAQLPLRYFNTEGLGPSPNPSPFDRQQQSQQQRSRGAGMGQQARAHAFTHAHAGASANGRGGQLGRELARMSRYASLPNNRDRYGSRSGGGMGGGYGSGSGYDGGHEYDGTDYDGAY